MSRSSYLRNGEAGFNDGTSVFAIQLPVADGLGSSGAGHQRFFRSPRARGHLKVLVLGGVISTPMISDKAGFGFVQRADFMVYDATFPDEGIPSLSPGSFHVAGDVADRRCCGAERSGAVSPQPEPRQRIAWRRSFRRSAMGQRLKARTWLSTPAFWLSASGRFVLLLPAARAGQKRQRQHGRR